MEPASPVAIVVDSAASLPDEMTSGPQVYVVPMRVTIGDRTYTDGGDLSRADFYRMLRESPSVLSTSAPPPASFLDAIHRAAEEARAVLCITVASRFSASFDSAKTAATEAKKAHRGLRVAVLDSGSAAGGEGLIALEAWRAASRGEALKRVRDAAQRIVPRVRLLASLDTLQYLWRGGRVPRMAYLGTSLLKIKPIFELAQGEIQTIARPRTQRKATERLLELMRDRVGENRVYAAVLHADVPEAAQELRRRVEAEFDCAELFVSEFTPVMAAHIGPGLVGAVFWSE